MKRFIYLLPLIFIFSCKKEPVNEPVGEQFPVVVKEYKLNQPLPNISITYYCCTWPDKQYGCLMTGPCGSVSTDAGGKASLSKASLYKAVGGIHIDGTGYWTQYINYPDSTIYLDRIGNVNVTLNPTQTYPAYAQIELSFVSERGRIVNVLHDNYLKDISLTQTLQAFAGQINSIKWRVYSYSQGTDIANGTISGVDVPLTGSTSVTVNL